MSIWNNYYWLEKSGVDMNPRRKCKRRNCRGTVTKQGIDLCDYHRQKPRVQPGEEVCGYCGERFIRQGWHCPHCGGC